MGSCVSSFSPTTGGDAGRATSAHVISINGDLLEFPGSITVSEALQKQSKNESCFICNSDRLNFDEYISELKAEYQLQAGQIYFMLPKTKLHYKLSASDMAALAVKASVALQKTSVKSSKTFSLRRKNKKSRISPVIIDFQQQEEDYSENGYISQDKFSNQKTSGLGVSRSGSVRKFQRLSSRRAKLAVRSFRLKLSTIYEGSVLQAH